MALIQRDYTRSGRRLIDDRDNRKRAYRSWLGQSNVPNGRSFRPYILFQAQDRVRYADDMECQFETDGWQVRKNGVDLVKFEAHPEVFRSGSFVRDPVLRSGFTYREVTNLNQASEFLEVEYTLTTANQVVTMILHFGGSYKFDIETRIRSIVGGVGRCVIANNVTERVQPRTALAPGGRTPPITGYDLPTRGFKFRWKEREAADHAVEIENSQFRIQLAEKAYFPNEEVIIRPESYGPSGIAADADDGDEQRSPSVWYTGGRYANGNLYIEPGVTTSVGWAAFRWDNVDLDGVPDSIDTPTQLVLENGGDNGGTVGDINWTLLGTNAYDPGQYADSNGNRPSDDTGTTATQTGTGQTGNLTQTVENIVEEWVETDGNSYSGAEAMRFWFEYTSGGTGGSDWWSLAEDYDGAGANVETTLEINYTSSGGRTTRNTDSHPLGVNHGVSFRMPQNYG